MQRPLANDLAPMTKGTLFTEKTRWVSFSYSAEGRCIHRAESGFLITKERTLPLGQTFLTLVPQNLNRLVKEQSLSKREKTDSTRITAIDLSVSVRLPASLSFSLLWRRCLSPIALLSALCQRSPESTRFWNGRDTQQIFVLYRKLQSEDLTASEAAEASVSW